MFINRLTSELFKEFTESVLLEHKNNKKMHDECIDIYSKTQFFDLSNADLNKVNEEAKNHEPKLDLLQNDDLQLIYDNLSLNLPFESVFIKTQFANLFMREFNQVTLTGCYIREIKDGYIYKQPFTITYLFNQMIVNFNTYNLICSLNKIYSNEQEQKKTYEYFLKFMVWDIYTISKIFEKLNKKTILIDEPIQNKPKYYRYKDKAKGTLKVNTRPIYIVLDEEKINKKCDYNKIHKQGILKRDFSFPVIGHWRRLSDNRHFGKDRQGNYNVQGYTWVKSFIKGNKDGIMQQRERIVL